MAVDNLEEYFEDKFRAYSGKTEKMTNCENSVYDKNSMMDNVDFSYVTMTEADVVKCVKLLTCGKACLYCKDLIVERENSGLNVVIVKNGAINRDDIEDTKDTKDPKTDCQLVEL